ncbi:hypothetical protein C8F01DRAFT_634887 [Mycena amicta]|nr:hypothetical protein C8F01DRAFT_634887 [Mycena amicta]
MHRCLQIPEIVWQVVGHVPRRHRKTLRALALTCRLFRDPALDQLWHDPGEDTLQYLIACFPPDSMTASIVAGELIVTLLRPVTLSDWDRPRQYCARVRNYEFGYLASRKYIDVLSLMSIWLPWNCLFPRLESLRCEISWAKQQTVATQHIKLFFSPTLRRLRLGGQSALILSSLPMIVVRALPLTHLELGNGVEPTDGECAAVSVLVRSLTRLQSLHVSGVDGVAVQHLATLVGLVSLELDSFPPDSLPRMLPTSPTFLTLQVLRISEADVPTLILLLPLLSNSQLQELQITPTNDTTTAQITQFCAAVATTISASSLRSFSLDHCGDADAIWGLSRDVFSC